ncbi:MAG: penicillin-binding protein activator [Desulfobacula sp.]|jgi:ABC-type branched-subunit amino acid transport system substrate-binding protein|uniref:penicillin-binding protein activator n=1 Tax=Desulfobacula sp. TaxID=2593537 RepID=UPI001D7B07BE|nr:penicillin-binding protein activator [Desulfobacula sp.]MBT3484419.1 penicillin-binding protein activator [Desulfobacula sp.]MBT3803334.1 penicillin-binding protein activator [Desulfobacula sp.]MBT4023699.1 penicillin-binding protein activator [Desulfobacula sp.]MBT4197941.1 penicillin-binding protein activator [Desulfobacula sp.]
MMSDYLNNYHYKYLIILFVIFCLSACAKMPAKVPVEKEKVQKEKIEEDSPKISIIKSLSHEAKKFAIQGDFQDALFIYNQALSQADADQKPQLISAIESVLVKTPAKTIQEFINIKNIHIPRSLLLYWLGLNYASENNAVKSREILEVFLLEYPDHPYYSDAADLVEDMKKSLFNRHTIGCLLPLTGKYAIFGKRALTGVQLAIQELSKKYDKQFKLIIKDTQANPDITIDCIQQLYKKNVAGIIGPLLMVHEAGQEAEKLQIPIIALTQKSDFSLKGEYLFSNFITPEMQVRTLGEYLFLNLGIKKVAILYPNEKYGKKYMKLFWDIVDEYEGEVVGVEAYDGKKTDFSDPIKKLTGQFFPIPDFLKPESVIPENDVKLNNDQADMDSAQTDALSDKPIKKGEEKIQIDFEALFIPDSPSKLNMILPQLAYYDAKGMYLVGTNLWHNKKLLKDVKGYNKQAVIADGFFDGSQNPATLEFTKKFKAVFNTKPKFLEAISYDTTSILFLSAMDETIDSRQSLKNALKVRRIFKGATGNTFFDKDGTAHRDLFLMTIKKGKFVEINR